MDISEFLISEEATMLEAMAQLDRLRKGPFCCEGRSVCCGYYRRRYQKVDTEKGSLDAKVRDIANYSPKSLPREKRARPGST